MHNRRSGRCETSLTENRLMAPDLHFYPETRLSYKEAYRPSFRSGRAPRFYKPAGPISPNGEERTK